jgi:hypothetical protein
VEYFNTGAPPENEWVKALIDMSGAYWAEFADFNPAYQGELLQTILKREARDKLPRHVIHCVPSLDVLRWDAIRLTTPRLVEALGRDAENSGPGCLENIFSSRMGHLFRNGFVDFFIGASIFDEEHLRVWLLLFPNAKQWNTSNDTYWSEVRISILNDPVRRAKIIAEAYSAYWRDTGREVLNVTWCSSFYYAFLAYIILLDCDDHRTLALLIHNLSTAAHKLRDVYYSIATPQLEALANKVPSVESRYSHLKTVIDLFAGRQLLWTDGGFRGISCPGVQVCSDKKSVVVIVHGLSFPLIMRDWNGETGEGWLAGFAHFRGIDMLGRDADMAGLPKDYVKGEKRIFKFR